MRIEFERRPALLLLLGMVAGLTAAAFLLNLVLLVAGAFWLRALPARVWLAAGFALGAALAPPLAPVSVSMEFQSVKGTVSTVPTLDRLGGSVFLVADARGVVWQVHAHEVPVLGDEVSILGTPSPVPARMVRNYAGKGVVALLDCPPSRFNVVRHAHGPAAWADSWRTSLVKYCQTNLTQQEAAVLEALALDVRTGLPEDSRLQLERSGTQHVLTTSGLHLLTLAWFLEFVLCRLPLPYLLRRLVILATVFLYALAAGLHPGAFRAAIATLMRDGAVVTAREYDPFSALGLAGCIYILWRPSCVYDPGFQMSMVLGFALSAARSSTLGLPAWSRLWRGSLIAWIASLPLTAYLFGSVSFVSIPANWVSMALLPFCLIGVLAAHGLSLVSAPLSQIFLAPTLLSTHLLAWTIKFFGTLPFWGTEIPAFSGYVLLPLYLVGLLAWRPRQRPM